MRARLGDVSYRSGSRNGNCRSCEGRGSPALFLSSHCGGPFWSYSIGTNIWILFPMIFAAMAIISGYRRMSAYSIPTLVVTQCRILHRSGLHR